MLWGGRKEGLIKHIKVVETGIMLISQSLPKKEAKKERKINRSSSLLNALAVCLTSRNSGQFSSGN